MPKEKRKVDDLDANKPNFIDWLIVFAFISITTLVMFILIGPNTDSTWSNIFLGLW